MLNLDYHVRNQSESKGINHFFANSILIRETIIYDIGMVTSGTDPGTVPIRGALIDKVVAPRLVLIAAARSFGS